MHKVPQSKSSGFAVSGAAH